MRDGADLLDHRGSRSRLFTINATTGVLSFVSAPNFEAPTDAGGNNVYDVTVQVSDGSLTDTQAIAVTVTNVAENAPVITSNGGGATAAVNVAENSTAVTTVTATDPDAGRRHLLDHRRRRSGLFTINETTGVLSFVAPPTSRRRPTPVATTSTTSRCRSPTAR